MRDFSLNKFTKLCNVIKEEGYHTYSISDYLEYNTEIKLPFIIVRHDVDIDLPLAVQMSNIEKELGINSTYYIRINGNHHLSDFSYLEKIDNNGHEIGYHYEVMDKSNGDTKEAVRLFEKDLAYLRSSFQISTVCMHGNPRTRWDNREVLEYLNFDNLNIIGEAYQSINFKEVLYLSDTSRTWSPKYKVKDNPSENWFEEKSNLISSTNSLIALIKSKEIKKLYLNSHPIWFDSNYKWYRHLLLQSAKNMLKRLIIKFNK